MILTLRQEPNQAGLIMSSSSGLLGFDMADDMTFPHSRFPADEFPKWQASSLAIPTIRG